MFILSSPEARNGLRAAAERHKVTPTRSCHSDSELYKSHARCGLSSARTQASGAVLIIRWNLRPHPPKCVFITSAVWGRDLPPFARRGHDTCANNVKVEPENFVTYKSGYQIPFALCTVQLKKSTGTIKDTTQECLFQRRLPLFGLSPAVFLNE